jgi:hypothetical protein
MKKKKKKKKVIFEIRKIKLKLTGQQEEKD